MIAAKILIIKKEKHMSHEVTKQYNARASAYI